MHDSAQSDEDIDTAVYRRTLDNGYEVVVYRMLGTNWRLNLEDPDNWAILDGWCYSDRATVLRAAEQWSGEGDPLDGWHRNPYSGRRRTNGDPSTEYVYP